MPLLFRRRGCVDDGILRIVPTPTCWPGALAAAHSSTHKGPSSCAQEMLITVLIDYGAKPAGLWRESDATL